MRRLGSSRQKLHFLSRDPRFLVRLALLILGVSFVVALITSTVHQGFLVRSAQSASVLERLETRLTGEAATAASIAEELRGIPYLVQGGFQKDTEPRQPFSADSLSLTSIEDMLADSPLDPSQRKLFVAYLNARFANDSLREEGREYVETHARMIPPHRFANGFLGDLLSNEDGIDEAIPCYEIEAAFPDEIYAWSKLVDIFSYRKDIEKTRALAADPRYRTNATSGQKMEVSLLLQDWTGLLWAVIAHDYRSQDLSKRLLAFFAATIWFLIIVQFGRFSKGRVVLYAAAILAGIASGTVTLYVLILQESVGGMRPEGNWIQLVLYQIVGVGVREEVVKLSLFALLLPFLLKRGNALDALLAAALVGLGFALQENVNYYRADETAALGRSVTANFIHFGMTGILGLALFETLRNPKRHWEEFLATFIGVILAHGIHNSLLTVAELSDYSILYLVIYVFIAQRFFHKAHQLKDARTHVLSPLAVFLVGTTVLLGVVLVYAVWNEPLKPAMIRVGYAGLGIFPIAFVFINQFKSD